MKTLATTAILSMMIHVMTFGQIIQGKVSGPENDVIPNAVIVLKHAVDHSVIKTIPADLDGNFQFDNIKAGKYYTEVIIPGMEKSTGVTFDYNSKTLILKPIVIIPIPTDLVQEAELN